MLSKKLLTDISNHAASIALTERFIRKYRKLENDYMVDKVTTELRNRGCFYTPTHDYIEKVFGAEVRERMSEYFYDKQTTLIGGMAIPLCTMNEDVLGLIINKPLLDVKYRYPESYIAKKGNCLGIHKQGFDRALDRDYVLINEGVFDEIFLSAIDEPAVRIDGYTLNKTTAKILNLIKNKLIISDNDKAGSKMFKNLEEVLNGNVVSVQLPTKDIADYLKSEENSNRFKSIIEYNREMGFPLKLLSI